MRGSIGQKIGSGGAGAREDVVIVLLAQRRSA
jgi:hypothetical protein